MALFIGYDKVDLLETFLLYIISIFALQFLKIAQILFKFERYEVFESNYDKNPS